MVFLDLEDAVAPEGEGGGPGQGRRRHQEPGLGRQGRSASGSTTGRPSGRSSTSSRWSATPGAARRDHAAQGARRPPQVVAMDLLLRQVEPAAGLPVGHIGIEAQIETTRGLINVEEICAASPRLETIIFGPADFAASMEMPVLTGGVQIPDVPGRPLPLRVLQDPHGRAGQRPAGDRRAVPLHPRPRRLPRLLPAHPDARLRRQVGAPPRPGHDPERGVLARRRSSSTGRGTSSRPTEQATEDERKGAVMFGDEMIDEAAARWRSSS